MRRTEQLQGLRLMKFEEVYDRTDRGVLSVAEAAEILGMSERNYRRWRDRFEAEGADGIYDRRLGRVSARRAAVDEVAEVLELFDTRYFDFTAKHLHDKSFSPSRKAPKLYRRWAPGQQATQLIRVTRTLGQFTKRLCVKIISKLDRC